MSPSGDARVVSVIAQALKGKPIKEKGKPIKEKGKPIKTSQ
jgi:hypothetical protein